MAECYGQEGDEEFFASINDSCDRTHSHKVTIALRWEAWRRYCARQYT